MLSDILKKAKPNIIVVQYNGHVSYKISSSLKLMQGEGSAPAASTAASELNEILQFLRIEMESRE